MPAKIKHCTSCGSDQIVVAGQKFLCRPCNIVYEVTDTGTKVLDTDPLGKQEQRLSQAEQDIADLKKQGGNETVEAPDPFGGGPIDRVVEPEKTDAEETEEPEAEEDGFVSWS
ncbi:MAG TPA: hypothetical protein VMY06_02615 [Sedimentisphaerales bacterium]|nr:hypothetical protein [Sedimentisphaerales bacterium]